MRLFFKTYLSPEPSGDYYWAPVENGARRKQQKTFKSRLLSWGGGKRMTKISLTKVEASKFMKFIKESSFALTEDEITGMNIFITTDGEKRFSLYRSLKKIKTSLNQS
jgi:hypothetical protein